MENSLYTGSIQVIVIDPVTLHQLSRQLIPDDRVHCLNTFSGDSVDQDDLDDYMVTSLQSQHISGHSALSRLLRSPQSSGSPCVALKVFL